MSKNSHGRILKLELKKQGKKLENSNYLRTNISSVRESILVQ